MRKITISFIQMAILLWASLLPAQIVLWALEGSTDYNYNFIDCTLTSGTNTRKSYKKHDLSISGSGGSIYYRSDIYKSGELTFDYMKTTYPVILVGINRLSQDKFPLTAKITSYYEGAWVQDPYPYDTGWTIRARKKIYNRSGGWYWSDWETMRWKLTEEEEKAGTNNFRYCYDHAPSGYNKAGCEPGGIKYKEMQRLISDNPGYDEYELQLVNIGKTPWEKDEKTCKLNRLSTLVSE